MPDKTTLAIAYAHQNQERFLSELKELIQIPSISTNPQNKEDIQKAADWMASHLRKLGMKNVHIFPTQLHPIVYSEHISEPQKPTVLIYGHYDVQPPDPLDLWKTPPFKPKIRGENLYARGASDMKGQILAGINAVEAVLAQGESPVNFKFILEGEEEIGSPSIEDFLEQHKELLTCDIILNLDAGILLSDTPTLTYALRGLAYFEIKVTSAKQDLHSGLFGGAVKNPAIALCELITGMHDEQERITLPNFYDRVRPLDSKEKTELGRLPVSDAFLLEQTGAPALSGEAGFTAIERIGARPTLDVNGFLSGFTGEGQKTVIPSWAMAKISMRLVPDQDPQEVHQQLLQYMEQNAPSTIHWEVKYLSGALASISDPHQPMPRAFFKALEDTWQTRPMLNREGGSIPIVGKMQNILKVDSILSGFGLMDDNIHAPNEKLHLPTWKKGIDAVIRFFYYLENIH